MDCRRRLEIVYGATIQVFDGASIDIVCHEIQTPFFKRIKI